MNQGVCSYALMPYVYTDCVTLPNNSQRIDAAFNTVLSWSTLSRNNVSGIKQALDLGYPVVIAFNVYQSFDNMWNSNGIWNSFNVEETSRGGHATCIIGYDDTKQMFKVQNSWGTSGGEIGYFWVTYNLVKNNCLNEVYVISQLNQSIYPNLSGPTQLCNQATYTITNFPQGATVNWIGSKTLNIITGQGISSIVCQKTLFAINGTTLPLRALITLSTGQTMELTKDIFIGTYPPAILLCPATYLPPFVPHVEYGYTNEDYYLFAHGENMSDTAADYLWKSYSPESSVLGTGRYIEFSKSIPGEYQVSVQYNGECGWSAEIFRNIRFEDILNVNLYPNPVTDILTAELTSNQTKSSSNLLTSTAHPDAYTIQLWNEYQGHVRSFEIVESKQQLSLQGLPSGMYIALVIKDSKTLQRKIIWKN